MRRPTLALATFAASLLVALSGCGGGGGGGQTTQPTPTTAPPAAAPSAEATTTTPPAAAGEEDEAAPLLAWADGTPEEGKAPLTVEFKADTEGGKAPLKYEWKFGDGTPDSNEPNPKHTYEKPGKYRADLTVSDSAGDSDTDYIEIEVQ